MALRASIGARDSDEITDLLSGLVALNLGQLRRGLVPPIYSPQAAHVRYQRESPGREVWQSALEVFRSGRGDCEDLASWLAASYQLVGVDAHAVIIDIRPGLKHCVTRLPDGTIEDPSKKLGMNGRG